MHNNLLGLICSKNNISYIVFDDDFRIIELHNVSARSGSDIREYLFEIIGLEDLILSQESVEIPMIKKGETYYDLSISPFFKSDDMTLFIAYMQERSKQTAEYAHVVKEINKKTLIYETGDEKKAGKYYKEINKRLLTLHVDLDGIITVANDAASHFFNLEKENIQGRHFSEFFIPQKSKTKNSSIFVAKNSLDKEIFFHADIIPLLDARNKIYENIIIAQDVSYLKEVEKELEYAQQHDTLTGVPNRHFLLKEIDKRIQKGANAPVALLDLRSFSLINEEYGAHAADMYLKYFTSVIKELIDPKDRVTRLYGDTFAILFEAEKNKNYIASILHKLSLELKSKPLYYTKEDAISTDFYFYVASATDDAKDAKELLELLKKEIQRKKIEEKKLS
jgi:diguanylate cyclase (GGDEF)-like protein